jgi:hypothetical protein
MAGSRLSMRVRVARAKPAETPGMLSPSRHPLGKRETGANPSTGLARLLPYFAAGLAMATPVAMK